MGISNTSKAKERSAKPVSHPEPRKTPKARKTPGPITKRHDEDISEMPDPWLIAPTKIPAGIYLTDYNTIVNDTQLWVWRYNKGMKFKELPFLSFREMENLVRAVGVRSSPDDMRDGVFNIIADIVTFACEWDRRHTYRSESVRESKLNFYALLRQEFYNATLTRLNQVGNAGSLDSHENNQQRKKVAEGLRALASIKPEVLMKVTETCLEARRNFLEREKIKIQNTTAEEESRENELVSSQLSNKMKSDMVLDTAERSELGQTAVKGSGDPPVRKEEPERHSMPAEQRMTVALDKFNGFVLEEERKRRVQVGKWLWAYGRPPADPVSAKHGRNHSS
ncbi:hypothetical protein GE09DRAFT_1216779 [Coniochaeta sp. 2T2.1]|nr:hypothetical protein GE09DRAFT_1216779 [Coniochaeta sp. 2T2.1]